MARCQGKYISITLLVIISVAAFLLPAGLQRFSTSGEISAALPISSLMRRHYVISMLYSQLGLLDEYLGSESNLSPISF